MATLYCVAIIFQFVSARMMFKYFFSDELTVDMCIYFGCSYFFMS